MLIFRLTAHEQTIYVLNNGGVQVNFTRFNENKKLGCIELFNRDLYIGIVSKAQASQFNSAMTAAKARKAA